MVLVRHEWDRRGRVYDEVDRELRNVIGLPATVPWSKSGDKRAFRGLVPKDRSQMLLDLWWSRSGILSDKENFFQKNRYFRSDPSCGDLFRTDKPFNCSRFKNVTVFDTSAYEQSTHQENLQVMEQLSRVLEPRPMELYSIVKDGHDMTRCRDRPFARVYIALLVVRL